MTGKAHILFVDDEKRVLNSMRGLFRREFELFLTTDGADALQIATNNSIDVVVADQRMPGMTGIEVLGKVKELSPRTVRILLTGYADPEAVEGSINIGEVFRFLSKPCAPQMLRDTLNLAVAASRSAPPVVEEQTISPPDAVAPTAPPVAVAPERREVPVQELPAKPVTSAPTPMAVAQSATPLANFATQQTPSPAPIAPPTDPDTSSSHWQKVTNIVLSGDTSREFRAPDFASHTSGNVKDVGIVFFTVDPMFVETAMRAASADRSVTLATSLAKVAQTIERKEAGVLVTDFTTNNTMLQKMISTLKQQLPELVTIVASDSRDTTDMISLINYGQVYRYVVKPIDPKQLMCEINAAAIKHLDLLNNPDSAKRHQVVNMADPDDASKSLNRFVTRIRQLRAVHSNLNDAPT